MSTEKSPTKVVTGKVRLSYFHGWEPNAIDESAEKKYSTSILIRKDDTATLSKIEAVVNHLKEEAKRKYNGKLPPKFKTPLRDGDEEKSDDPAYADCFFLSASSKTKPGIVGLEKTSDNKYKEITDEDEVYSGCYARVSMNLYLFDVSGNKGIACGLNNIQKVADGERMAGKTDANEDFADEYVAEDDFL